MFVELAIASQSRYLVTYDKKEILQSFDDVMSKVKKRKVPHWDKV